MNPTLLFLSGIGFQEVLLLLVSAIFWITSVILLVKAKQDSTIKLIWILVILFVPFLCSLLYLIVGRNQNLVA